MGNLETDEGKVSNEKGNTQTMHNFFTSGCTCENTEEVLELEKARELKDSPEGPTCGGLGSGKKVVQILSSKSTGPNQMHYRILKGLSRCHQCYPSYHHE